MESFTAFALANYLSIPSVFFENILSTYVYTLGTTFTIFSYPLARELSFSCFQSSVFLGPLSWKTKILYWAGSAGPKHYSDNRILYFSVLHLVKDAESMFTSLSLHNFKNSVLTLLIPLQACKSENLI